MKSMILHNDDEFNIKFRPAMTSELKIIGFKNKRGQKYILQNLTFNSTEITLFDIDFIFDLSNRGKFVAEEVNAKIIKITKIKSTIFSQINVHGDIAPNHTQEITLKCQVTNLDLFSIEFEFVWKYGNKKKGKISLIVEINPFTREQYFLKNHISLTEK